MPTYFKKSPAATSTTGLPPLLTAATASPVASFTTSIASRTVVTFNAANSTTGYSGGIRRYIWDLGNGRFAEGRTVSHKYHNFGTYSVKLTVVDAAFRTATVTQSVSILPLVADKFDRANSTSMGSATNGTSSKAWSTLGSSGFGIQDNQATAVSGTGTSACVVDVGKTGGTSELDFSIQGNTHNRVGLMVFRAVDINNFFFIQSYFPPSGYAYRLMKKVGGTNTELQFLDQGPMNGDRHRIEDDGSTIVWYINDVKVKTVSSETSLNTATKQGFGGAFNSDPSSFFDNFAYWG